MRAHSTTKGVLGCLVVLGACAGLGACDPVYYGGAPIDEPTFTGDGRIAISWTLNGTVMTPERCKSERIDSMNVLLLSEIDQGSHAEFINVTCGLDKYPLTMVPTGPLRVFVDAVRGSSPNTCVRYTGRISLTATTQFPSTPTQVPLKLAGTCP